MSKVGYTEMQQAYIALMQDRIQRDKKLTKIKMKNPTNEFEVGTVETPVILPTKTQNEVQKLSLKRINGQIKIFDLQDKVDTGQEIEGQDMGQDTRSNSQKINDLLYMRNQALQNSIRLFDDQIEAGQFMNIIASDDNFIKFFNTNFPKILNRLTDSNTLLEASFVKRFVDNMINTQAKLAIEADTMAISSVVTDFISTTHDPSEFKSGELSNLVRSLRPNTSSRANIDKLNERIQITQTYYITKFDSSSIADKETVYSGICLQYGYRNVNLLGLDMQNNCDVIKNYLYSKGIIDDGKVSNKISNNIVITHQAGDKVDLGQYNFNFNSVVDALIIDFDQLPIEIQEDIFNNFYFGLRFDSDLIKSQIFEAYDQIDGAYQRGDATEIENIIYNFGIESLRQFDSNRLTPLEKASMFTQKLILVAQQIYKRFIDNVVKKEIQDYRGLLSENALKTFIELIKPYTKDKTAKKKQIEDYTIFYNDIKSNNQSLKQVEYSKFQFEGLLKLYIDLYGYISSNRRSVQIILNNVNGMKKGLSRASKEITEDELDEFIEAFLITMNNAYNKFYKLSGEDDAPTNGIYVKPPQYSKENNPFDSAVEESKQGDASLPVEAIIDNSQPIVSPTNPNIDDIVMHDLYIIVNSKPDLHKLVREKTQTPEINSYLFKTLVDPNATFDQSILDQKLDNIFAILDAIMNIDQTSLKPAVEHYTGIQYNDMPELFKATNDLLLNTIVPPIEGVINNPSIATEPITALGLRRQRRGKSRTHVRPIHRRR